LTIKSHASCAKHGPEKWSPVSRLREAWQMLCVRVEASAGVGRSEKIVLKQKAKAKYRINVSL
jgi:hypothetical protein